MGNLFSSPPQDPPDLNKIEYLGLLPSRWIEEGPKTETSSQKKENDLGFIKPFGTATNNSTLPKLI